MRRSLIVTEYSVLYNFRADNIISVCAMCNHIPISVNQGKISVEYSTVSYLFRHP